MKPNWIVVGALWAFVGVGLGAFGAHGLEKTASAEGLAWWNTGVRYHLLHATALVLVGVLALHRPVRPWAGWSFLLGSVVFSGTLYALAFGGPRFLGAITPVGGVALMVGWLLLALEGRRSPSAAA